VQEADTFRFDDIADDDGERDLCSDHPDAVKLLIDFMYHCNYSIDAAQTIDEPRTNNENKEPPIVDHLSPPKTLDSKQKKKGDESATPSAFWASQPKNTDSCNITDGPLATHVRVFALACKYFVTPLKNEAITKFKARISRGAIKIAYGTTPGKRDMQMRDCVFECITSHLSDVLSEEITRAAIDQVEGLTMQLLVKEKLRLYVQEFTEPCFWVDDDKSLLQD
jgi:hypothetical protein